MQSRAYMYEVRPRPAVVWHTAWRAHQSAPRCSLRAQRSTLLTVQQHKCTLLTVQQHKCTLLTVQRHKCTLLTVQQHKCTLLTVQQHKCTLLTVQQHKCSINPPALACGPRALQLRARSAAPHPRSPQCRPCPSSRAATAHPVAHGRAGQESQWKGRRAPPPWESSRAREWGQRSRYGMKAVHR